MSSSMKIIKRLVYGCCVVIGCVAAPLYAQDTQEAAERKLFAVINGEEVELTYYVQSLRDAGKNRFYHGRAPEAEIKAFKYEVGQELINTTLLLQESDRRGIEADGAWVEARYSKLIDRFSKHPKWEEDKDRLKRDVHDRLDKQSRLKILEDQVKDVATPAEAELEAYYQQHSDKFTSPGRFRASTILLKVEPWAPQDAWESAKAEAERILKDIKGGADFAEMAAIYSQDPSADEGGDLGYQHEGMLGETVQNVLNELQEGEMSGVVQLLEGYAIFKLIKRDQPVLNPLSTVRERAQELWLREARDKSLKNLLRELRGKAVIKIIDPIYLELMAGRAAAVEQEEK